MEEVFFKKLSKKLTREVLARLPIRSIMRCKCVCKSWRALIEGCKFAMTYTSKPGLCISSKDRGYTVCDGETFDPLFGFTIHRDILYACANIFVDRHVIDSVNGLLLLLLRYGYDYVYYVCNPITRECVVLPSLAPLLRSGANSMLGFGVSKLSGKYKVLYVVEYRLYVCDLGGGTWRTISEEAPGRRILLNKTTFFNGNLHWLALDIENNPIVCCFDLETELCTRFSLPPRVYGNEKLQQSRLCVLDGQLCLCDVKFDRVVVIWAMNIYGDENSWIKEYMFHRPHHIDSYVRPVTILANGDLLFITKYIGRLLIYSTKNSRHLASFDLPKRVEEFESEVAIYTPSFYSIKANGVGHVILHST